MSRATFAFAPGLRARFSGEAAGVRHALLEYGPCAVPDDEEDVGLEVVFGHLGGPSDPRWSVAHSSGRPGDHEPARGGHKTVSWAIRLGDPAGPVLQAEIAVSGWPRSFARSLVQGYVVEPLLSLAAARHGHVLLSSAGIVGDEGLLVIVGRSRAGKSTLAALAMARGRRVLGDDQLIVDGEGRWRPFPRRLRVYPDLTRAAPTAWTRLGGSTRRTLRLRAAVAILSRGFIRPSLAVDPAELGGTWRPEPVRAARIVLVERRPDVDAVRSVAAGVEQAVAWSREVIASQRERLAGLGGPGWRSSLEAAAEVETALLRRAFAGLAVESIAVPAGWPAPAAIAALARELRLEG